MSGRGLLISFEGIDGCGKSTQLALLAQRLEAEGQACLCLREPGGTALGEAIRGLLLEARETAIHPRAELLLFNAARAELVEERIKPALEAGVWVLLDRFVDSTRAYQGGGRGLSKEELEDTLRFACAGLQADLRLLLDISPQEALSRRQLRGGGPDRFEAEGLAFMETVAQRYRQLAQEDEGLLRLDASQEAELLAQQVWEEIQARRP